MHDNFVKTLVCPRCAKGDLALDVAERTSAEVRTGSLRCRHCELTMTIRDGAVDALAVASETAQIEIAGNTEMVRRERATADDAWLLALPKSYAQYYQDKDESWQNEEKEVKALIELANPAPGSLVLDVGAGTTWSTNELARRGCRAIALDVSHEKFVGLSSSDVFMAHYGTHYERLAADMSRRLPFLDGAIDTIFVFSALHHAPDLAATFAELARILKPGGTLAFVEATRGMLEADDFGAREIESFGINEHKYPLSRYHEVSRAAGLKLQIHVAPSFTAKMNGFSRGNLRSPGPMYLKHRLGRLIARTLWRMPGMSRVAAVGYPLLCRVFGAQILAIARHRA